MRTLLVALLAVASLAGCIEDMPDDNLPPNTSGPADGVNPPEPGTFDEDVNGDLHVSGWLEECPAGHCLSLRAENEGDSVYYVEDGTCNIPWSEAMEKDGNTVYPREPMFHCEAFSVEEMGSHATATYSWDHTLWDDSEGGYVDAPPGSYTWTIQFRAYESNEGGSPIDLFASFTVTLE